MLRIEMVVLMVVMSFATCGPSDPGSNPAEKAETPRALGADVRADQPHAVLPGGEKLALEVARSDAQRARGLMFRESLPEYHGMLFVFTESERHGFWMKNTFIPLDMLWLAEDGTVTEIKRGVPPCSSDPCPTYVPERGGRYVLELAAGEADRLGLVEESRIELRNIATTENG